MLENNTQESKYTGPNFLFQITQLHSKGSNKTAPLFDPSQVNLKLSPKNTWENLDYNQSALPLVVKDDVLVLKNLIKNEKCTLNNSTLEYGKQYILSKGDQLAIGDRRYNISETKIDNLEQLKSVLNIPEEKDQAQTYENFLQQFINSNNSGPMPNPEPNPTPTPDSTEKSINPKPSLKLKKSDPSGGNKGQRAKGKGKKRR